MDSGAAQRSAPCPRSQNGSGRNMKASQKLEQQIERIHQLIEADGTTVTWNDRVPDPDNGSRPRQIDVTIRRDGHLTLVECRLHKEPQDVTWIEELIGRRESLKANAVIAVSASGFTEGAIKKAAAKDIILRSFDNLSEDEIKNWGREIGVRVSTCRFIKCGLSVILPSAPSPPPKVSAPDGSTIDLLPVFGKVMDTIEEHGAHDGRHLVDLDIEAGLLVSGVAPISATFTAEVEYQTKDLRTSAVVGYSSAGEDSVSAYAVVRQFNNETIEIIDSANALAVVLDLSSVGLAPDEYVRAAEFDFGIIRDVSWFHVIGIETMTYSGPLSLHVRFPNNRRE